MIPRPLVLVVLAAGLATAGSTAMADFLVMQKTPDVHPTHTANFCAGKKDQDYCSDQHTLSRCRSGVAATRIFCPAGCSAMLAGSAVCNTPPSGN